MKNKSIDRIIEILEAFDIEIVSYGLAPNPNGFCFELPTQCKASYTEIKELDDLLNSLNKNETNYLRNLIF